MTKDDDFKPRLGRQRSKDGKRARSYLSRVVAASNLARGGAPGGASKPGFTGSRSGRGAGVGRVLASRDRFAALRQRRVIIKSRIVRLAGKGLSGAAAHLRYVQRDGVTREGEPGSLYDARDDRSDGKTFLDRAQGDRHQFRFIVSPEDGADYDDLKPLTRRLMAQMEQDLGTRLDWVAVDHFNTGHPHTHILLRGRDDQGGDLVIARDYLTTGMRERAAELVDLDLGPRDDRAIEARLRAEVSQERLTSIDRNLLRDADADRVVTAHGSEPLAQSLRAGRLTKLAALGLAEPLGGGRCRLADRIDETLTKMGERGDIIRTLQRAYRDRAVQATLADQAIYDPAAPGVRPLVGRLVERGLSDELRDRHYLIVDGSDGRSHYVTIGKGDAVAPIPADALVRIDPLEIAPRPADRVVAAVAAGNGGRYTIDAHLRHDPAASEDFARTHVRRLEAMRRQGGFATREPDGSWTIAPDHIDRARAYEARRALDMPVRVTTLAVQPLDRQVAAEGVTWLDRQLVATDPEPLRDVGFGRDARVALDARRQWLIENGFAEAKGEQTLYRPTLLRDLERRELARVGAQLARDTGLPFTAAQTGDPIEGRLRRAIDLSSGRYALIERSHDFTLVPWRPALEHQLGRPVSGIMRSDGINWTIGRQRGGPVIS